MNVIHTKDINRRIAEIEQLLFELPIELATLKEVRKGTVYLDQLPSDVGGATHDPSGTSPTTA